MPGCSPGRLGRRPSRSSSGQLFRSFRFSLLIGVGRPFAAYFLALDLSLAASIQGWRAGGFAFLALYAHGILPGAFAWPAGLGDIAIGVTAPWIARALARSPDFARSRAFTTWNLLGILDLVVAIGSGGLNSVLTSDGPSTAPMAQLPLVLIPAYLVPMFIMLHLAALLQTHRQAPPVGLAGQPD